MSVLLGPVNALHHPFLVPRDDVSALVGPLETHGHPFRVVTEVPVRREVGPHVAYAFATHWLYSNLEIEPDEGVEAILLWDPGWLRDGAMGTARNEIRSVWELSRAWDVPLIGIYSDWFAAWKVDRGIVGTLGSLMYVDAVIVDPVGAAALRTAPPLRVEDSEDYRYRPVVEMERFLTYGRLPSIGGGVGMEIAPFEERSVDVSMVSTLHPEHVVMRPYYVEAARAACERNGWRFEFRGRASVEEMEELYLDSKVVFNVALGCQPNCRVYEALACGALLVTDAWTRGMEDAPAWRFNSADAVEHSLYHALRDTHLTRYSGHQQEKGLAWAREHSPRRTWERLIAAALEAAPRTDAARAARLEWEDEMKSAGLS